MKSLLCLLLFVATLLPNFATAQIESGAVIQISIQGVPQKEHTRINASYPVSDNGYITMWHIGSIRAAGLKPEVLARKIEKAYVDAEIYTSPTFQIIADSGDTLTQHLVTVGGQVRSPGPKPFSRGMTLYQAVMAAGGATEFGAIKRISVFRNNKRYTYDLTKGEHKMLKLQPKDTIDVPQTKLFERR